MLTACWIWFSCAEYFMMLHAQSLTCNVSVWLQCFTLNFKKWNLGYCLLIFVSFAKRYDLCSSMEQHNKDFWQNVQAALFNTVKVNGDYRCQQFLWIIFCFFFHTQRYCMTWRLVLRTSVIWCFYAFLAFLEPHTIIIEQSEHSSKRLLCVPQKQIKLKWQGWSIPLKS